MAPRDKLPVLEFRSAQAFGSWLEEHHATAAGLWLKIPKKGNGIPGPTYAEALDEALRFGWIDSQKARLDDDFYMQRFTPRTARSRWSKINRKKVEALVAAGRMAPAGLAAVAKAKQDGRWDGADDSPRTARVPHDLQAALEANPEALRFFEGLTSSNRYAILSRVHEAKRLPTRERRIAKYVAMCARGETVY
jgi:uncharacterized protein YdeI (YjbR/CyaY-like superfamily)